MGSMGLKSETTGNNYKKSENMWNGFSGNTGAFLKLNNIENNNIEGSSGTQLVTSLNVFSTWMLSKLKTVLYGQKNLCWIPEFMLKTIETSCVIMTIFIFFL